MVNKRINFKRSICLSVSNDGAATILEMENYQDSTNYQTTPKTTLDFTIVVQGKVRSWLCLLYNLSE